MVQVDSGSQTGTSLTQTCYKTEQWELVWYKSDQSLNMHARSFIVIYHYISLKKLNAFSAVHYA